MQKRDWLLIALGDRMEPIQVQKTLFKFAQEANAPLAEIYQFEPYNWGPCSFDIYDDLAALRAEGFVEFVPAGSGWNAYRTTAAGQERVKELRSKAPAPQLAEIDRVREYVVSRGFRQLLRDVYKDYPQYAERSLFKTAPA